ncbi:hypothetical protein M2266_001254 [Streptomyces sp. SPB162]|nr:hypothetical protein [Streptomyces sp. SPB162]
MGGRVGREFAQRALHRPRQPRLGGRQGRAAEVDDGARGVRRERVEDPARQRVALRYGGPAAGAPPGAGEALGAQRLVRGGDGGAADAQREGELPLGGQPGGDRHPALEHQQPYPVGESAVGRDAPATAAGGRAGFEEPGERRRSYRCSPLRHKIQSTFP